MFEQVLFMIGVPLCLSISSLIGNPSHMWDTISMHGIASVFHPRPCLGWMEWNECKNPPFVASHVGTSWNIMSWVLMWNGGGLDLA